MLPTPLTPLSAPGAPAPPPDGRTAATHPSREAGTVQRGRAQETKAKTRLLEATGSLPEVTNLRSMRTAGGARPGDGGWSLGGSAGRGAVSPAGSPQNAPQNTLPSQEALQLAGKSNSPRREEFEAYAGTAPAL